MKNYRVVMGPLKRHGSSSDAVWSDTWQVLDLHDGLVCTCEKKHNADLIAKLLENNT